MKLPIKQLYTIEKQDTVRVTDGIDAAWAIVANAKFLSEYFDWVSPLFSEILQSYGNPFAAGTQDAYRSEALNVVVTAVIKNGWLLVLAEGDKATIFGDFRPYARALVNELKGTVLQKPQNVRVGIINSVTTASLDGSNIDAEIPVDQLLQANPT